MWRILTLIQMQKPNDTALLYYHSLSRNKEYYRCVILDLPSKTDIIHIYKCISYTTFHCFKYFNVLSVT